MRLHRWVALALGAWFALLGLTGAVLVWHAEIDRALNPAWFAPLPACGAPSSAPIAMSLALFQPRAQGATAQQVVAPTTPGAAYMVTTKPGDDGLRRQHFVDPACGRHLGVRTWGALRLDRAHIVPAFYEFHRALLSKEAGHVAVGFAGLALLFVAVSGAFAAWPRQQTRDAWRRTLTLKRNASRTRRHYDLHRATGMWLLAFLLLMALTGTYLCFPKQARALVAVALPTSPAEMRKAAPAPVAPLQADQLARRAQALWDGARWTRVQVAGGQDGAFDLRLMQREELRADTGDTRVRLDRDGRVVDVRDPLRGPAGDRLLSWLFPLHSGEALGPVGRLAWTVFGLAPLLLFATGLWLWLRTTRSRSQGRMASGTMSVS